MSFDLPRFLRGWLYTALMGEYMPEDIDRRLGLTGIDALRKKAAVKTPRQGLGS
jgi:hypothetical protein